MEQRLPFLSVIIPTHNRRAQVQGCLQALAQQLYPHDLFEVIVVDDGSTNPPRDIVAFFSGALNVVLLAERHGGPSAARNAGASQAGGEFLVFTDDDCAPSPEWLQNIASHLSSSPACLVGGHTINALTENIYSETSQALIDVIYARYNRDPADAKFLASNNIAMSAAQFHAVGGFDSRFHFAEDRNFCERWLRHGYHMIYVRDVVIYHRHHLSARSLWRQHFNYGRGACLFHEANKQHGSKFEFDSRFYISIFRFPLVNATGLRAFKMEVLMAEIQMANAAGFFFQATKKRALKPEQAQPATPQTPE